jgi:hypothetical protein
VSRAGVVAALRSQSRLLVRLEQVAAVGNRQLPVDVTVGDHCASFIDGFTMALSGHKVK